MKVYYCIPYKNCGMARIKLRCIMGCPGLKSSYQEKDPLCFISDDNNHNTNFVYKMQIILVDCLKENLPIVNKIFYFCDDCAEQYKNHKVFINLCHHQQSLI